MNIKQWKEGLIDYLANIIWPEDKRTESCYCRKCDIHLICEHSDAEQHIASMCGTCAE